MQDRKAIQIAAVTVILGAGLALGVSLSGGCGPRINSALYRQTGKALARQALALLKPGGQLTVITRDTVAFQNPASDFVLAGFQRELAGAGRKIDSLQSIQIDPLRPLEVPSGDFLQWIKKASEGSVIVSFMGPPVLSETQLAQLGQSKPAIVALCPGKLRDRVDLRSLFAQGLLRAAVVGRTHLVLPAGQNLNSRQLFDHYFVEVTPSNVATVLNE